MLPATIALKPPVVGSMSAMAIFQQLGFSCSLAPFRHLRGCLRLRNFLLEHSRKAWHKGNGSESDLS